MLHSPQTFGLLARQLAAANADKNSPSLSRDSTEPIEPMEPIDSIEPIEPIEPRDSSFTSSYAGRARRLVALVNALRDGGAPVDLGLPALAVAGNQSVGKSSLVEALAGVRLPRTEGTCTRCVTELRLAERTQTHQSRWACAVRLRFEFDESGAPLPAVRELPFGPPITSRRLVAAAVARAQKAILNPSIDPAVFINAPDPDANATTSNTLDELMFSKNVVCLDIIGAAANLSLVDLPGIVRSVEHRDDSPYIALVQDLVRSYIERERTIIVAVVTCKDEIENQSIFHMAREVDPSGSRTIGVLTKPDTIELGTADRWLDILLGRAFPLKLGYFMVRCLTKAEIDLGKSIDDSRQIEDAFFSQSPIWGPARRKSNRFGVPALRTEMSRLLTALIGQSLPRIKLLAEEAINATIIDLAQIPTAIGENPRIELLQMIRHFCMLVSNNINADHDFKVFYQRVRTHFDLLRDRIASTRPSFDLDKKGHFATSPSTSISSSLSSSPTPSSGLGVFSTQSLSASLRNESARCSSPIAHTHTNNGATTTNLSGSTSSKGIASSAWNAAASSFSLASSLSMAIPNKIFSSIKGSGDITGSVHSSPSRSMPIPNHNQAPAVGFTGMRHSAYTNHKEPEKLDAHRPFTIADLRRIIESQKGREIQGYSPYSAFTSLVYACQEDWGQHASACLIAISQELCVLVTELIDDVFGRFTALHSKISLATQSLQGDLQRVAANQINHLLVMERRYPFTLNSNVFVERKTRFLSMLDGRMDKHGAANGVSGGGAGIGQGSLPSNTSSSAHGHTGTRTQSQTCPQALDPAIIDLMASSLSYMEIAISRVSDTVPMTIEYHFLAQFNDILEKHLLSQLCVLDASTHELADLLHEDWSIAERRKAIEARRVRLEAAWRSMHEFGV